MTIHFFDWEFCVGQQDAFPLTMILIKMFLTKIGVLISLIGITRTRKNCNVFTIGSTLEQFKINVTKFTFLSKLPATFGGYPKRYWETRKRSSCKLWKYRFVKKQGHKIIAKLWAVMLKDLQFKRFSWYRYWRKNIVDWVLFTLGKTCFKEVNLSETMSSKTNTMFSDQSFLTDIETQHLFNTVRFWLTCRHL